MTPASQTPVEALLAQCSRADLERLLVQSIKTGAAVSRDAVLALLPAGVSARSTDSFDPMDDALLHAYDASAEQREAHAAAARLQQRWHHHWTPTSPRHSAPPRFTRGDTAQRVNTVLADDFEDPPEPPPLVASLSLGQQISSGASFDDEVRASWGAANLEDQRRWVAEVMAEAGEAEDASMRSSSGGASSGLRI